MRTLIAATLLVVAAPVAFAQTMHGGAVMVSASEKGKILTDSHGMTLYTYDHDKQGMSDCYNECAVSWPPLKAETSAMPKGKFSVIKRKDGTSQWAYNGKPLYLWAGDKKPGETSGDGVGGVWHIAVE